MGKWITAEEVKTVTQVPNLKLLTVEQIERLYVKPAEDRIEETFNLDLETSRTDPPVTSPENIPCHWRARFDQYPDRKKKFIADAKDAVLLLVEAKATNPQGLRSQSVGGASAQFGRDMPPEVGSKMRKWGLMQNRLFRT